MAVRHRTRGNGQLRPLAERINEYQKYRRAARIADRSHTENIAIMAIQKANVALSVWQRGFFGRLKAVVLGR